jgi:Cu(I)/Ag(I) efflux system membrane fusion protein
MLAISAPFDGEVVERASVQGEFVEPGAPLFTLTDRSTVWAMLSIPESALGEIVTGQEVHVKTSSFSDEVFKGTLSWISASVELNTRMAKARVEVENVSGKLRNNMFVEAEILQRSTQAGLFVPKQAIQKIDGTNFVFVRLEEDLYAVHPVQIGTKTDSEVEVLSGIANDQAVVSAQSFALKSQFLLSRLGAGCVDD